MMELSQPLQANIKMATLRHLTLTAIAIILTSHLPHVSTTTTSTRPPQAHTLNGTYTGLHLPFFSQDLFLGIPYAQSTADNNRFRPPQSLNTSWSGSHPATSYSPACPDHAPPSPINNDTLHGMSEDCLSINIVRPSPSREQEQKPLLPVVLWIHGGSYQFGTSGLPRYNLSFIVQRSVEMGKPILAASINYRKSSWGLLFSQEMMGSGNTNQALRDMIKALEWVQENIASFGGDPGRVTIWGESSGSFAVGQLVVAYGGRLGGPAATGDGKGKGKGKGTGKPLFHATIQESGSATTAWYNGTSRYQPIYDLLVQRANCSSSEPDTLACLRTIPYPNLYPLMSPYTLITDGGPGFYPIIDGDLIPAFPSLLLAQGRFASDIPHLLGTNSDEGTDNAPRWGISTDEQIFALVSSQSGFNFPESTVQQILDLYQDDDPAKEGIPLDTGNSTFEESSRRRGKQYKRAAAILGDVFYHSPRLFDARQYSLHGTSPNSTFVYRFNTRPWLSRVNLQYQGLLGPGTEPGAAGTSDGSEQVNVTCEPQAASGPGGFGNGEIRCGALAPAADGVAHATELAFVFQNPEFLGPWSGYWGLSDAMTEFWINFVSEGTPNGDRNQNGDRKVVVWPAYASGDGKEEGVDLVLQTEEQGGLVVERDTWRLEGRELLGRWARRRNV